MSISFYSPVHPMRAVMVFFLFSLSLIIKKLLLRAYYRPKCLTNINPLNPTYEIDTVIIWFYRWSNWGRGITWTWVRQLPSTELWCKSKLFASRSCTLDLYTTLLNMCHKLQWNILAKGCSKDLHHANRPRNRGDDTSGRRTWSFRKTWVGLAARKFEEQKESDFKWNYISSDGQGNKHFFSLHRLLLNILLFSKNFLKQQTSRFVEAVVNI